MGPGLRVSGFHLKASLPPLWLFAELPDLARFGPH